MPHPSETQRRPLHIPTDDEARVILGGRLPSIIENIQFTEDGLVETGDGLKVPIYVASPFGFNAPGRQYLQEVIKPNLEAAGAFVIDPFEACAEFLDPNVFDPTQTVGAQRETWTRFNRDVIGTVNYGLLIPRAKIMFAILEGHAIDDGVAAEIAYMAANFGPVVGVRTDFRLAENPATGTNPAVTYFLDRQQYGGGYFEGPDAYTDAFAHVEEITTEIRESAVEQDTIPVRSGRQQIVMKYIITHCIPDQPLNSKEIAKGTGLSRAEVSYCLISLRHKGYITKKKIEVRLFSTVGQFKKMARELAQPKLAKPVLRVVPQPPTDPSEKDGTDTQEPLPIRLQLVADFLNTQITGTGKSRQRVNIIALAGQLQISPRTCERLLSELAPFDIVSVRETSEGKGFIFFADQYSRFDPHKEQKPS